MSTQTSLQVDAERIGWSDESDCDGTILVALEIGTSRVLGRVVSVSRGWLVELYDADEPGFVDAGCVGGSDQDATTALIDRLAGPPRRRAWAA